MALLKIILMTMIIMNLKIFNDVVLRVQNTESQTKKGRIERWQNIEGKFELARTEKIQNKHLLLVDDVVTTGATLEACAQQLCNVNGTKISIATLCYAR